MNRKIKEQRAYVKQLEDALKFYASADPANYKDLSRIIRTSQDYLYVETGKLNRMEAGL